jgi:large subunit ribosomal protein L13
MKTFSPKPDLHKPEWHVFNAEGQVLGRLASQIAPLLMGKHKNTYSPHIIMGDHVVVINASKIKVTGRKEKQKNYYQYSGYPGGLKVTPLFRMRQEHPERIIKHAVSGMLPKNKLHDKFLKNLHVYEDANHPYTDKISNK